MTDLSENVVRHDLSANSDIIWRKYIKKIFFIKNRNIREQRPDWIITGKRNKKRSQNEEKFN